MATFNGAKFIRKQLESILVQLPEDSEVIISDNGSSDNTCEVIRSMCDRRISLYQFSEKNVVLNFENALRKSSGDIIFLADQDDIWLDGKVDRVIEELAEVDLVMTNGHIVDGDLNHLDISLFDKRKPHIGVLSNLYRNSFVGCCMAFRRVVLDAALPFPRALPMHDWWIGLVGKIVGSVRIVNEPFLLYRRHGGNLSETTGTSRYGVFKKVSMRFFLVRKLTSIFVNKILFARWGRM